MKDDAIRPVSGRRKFRAGRILLYILYVFICAEIGSKLFLFSPWISERLSFGTESGCRIKWVLRHLKRESFYGFDSFDATKGWSLKPGLKQAPFTLPRMTLSSNSRGIRGSREYAYGKPGSVKRILVLGDSFTFGEGVDDDETYPFLTEKFLGKGFEVINMGIHGYGHDQMLLKLREEGLRYRPDIVVLGYLAADNERNLFAFRDYAKPRFVLRKNGLRLCNVPVSSPRQVLEQEIFRLHLADVWSIAYDRLPWEKARRARDKAAVTSAILDRMKEESEAAGARFVILHLPYIKDIPSASETVHSEKFITDYAERRQAILCKPRKFLKSRLEGKQDRGGVHYDAETHAAVAEALGDFLKRERLVG